ncbi:MAG: hypothetical protein PHH61_06230 [Candidatus Nanoarchaeia archaeon]|nr:hypothetical protein [Candidatus Nanoarchaeia archaeon]
MSGKSTGYCSKQFLGTCDYLKVAQKEIAEYKLALSQRIRLLNEAEVKVEAAKALLKESDMYPQFFDATELRERLRKILLEIPRSDEQKPNCNTCEYYEDVYGTCKSPNPPEVPAFCTDKSYKRKEEVFYDCQGYGPQKIVKKENTTP